VSPLHLPGLPLHILLHIPLEIWDRVPQKETKSTAQRGQIFQRHGAWHLRYSVREQGKWKQVGQKLADVSDRYRTKRSIQGLAAEVLEPIKSGTRGAEPTTLQQFAETVYFQYAKTNLKPSTYKGYFNLHTAQDMGLRRLACLPT
jgi:hypothetical protein